MNPPSTKSSLPRAPGIPRPSRLPVPHSASEPPIPIIPAKYKLRVPVTRPKTVQNATSESCQNKQGKDQAPKPAVLEGTKIEEASSTSNVDERNLDFDKNGEEATNDAGIRRRPRPSLSDRTIETLSQIPPSPSPRRRRSSFFPPESPAVSPARPATSMSRSRPPSSLEQRPPIPPMPSIAPRATSPVKRPIGPVSTKTTPSRRAVTSYVPQSVPHAGSKAKDVVDTTPSKPSRPVNGANPLSAVDSITSKARSKPLGTSRTYAPRSSKPRPMVGDAFVKPTAPKQAPKPNIRGRRDVSSISTESAQSAISRSLFSPTSRTSSRTSEASTEPIPTSTAKDSTANKSSAALREAISKAKAERRKALERPGSRNTGPKAFIDDISTTVDNSGLLRKRIETARTDGRLNIAAMGLSKIPSDVLQMYDLDALDTNNGAWYESVDIRRLNAAENQLEELDELFPDNSVEELRYEDDETKGTIFGGLESLDLHGNSLQKVPQGLRQLEHLTNLNLSKNRLTNGCIDTLCQMRSLRELRVAENALEGPLSRSLYALTGLQVLDVHGNGISELPDGLQELVHLRILDVASNRLRSFPFGAVDRLPITELNVACNRMVGTLLPLDFDGLPCLRSLNVSGNALTSICDTGTLIMPELQSFSVGENRLTALPDLSGWSNLTTLSADNNNIAAIPEGMISLMKLRNVDFTGNNLKKLDDRIGLMEGLTSITLSNNPLRERRFLTMATDSIKTELRNRLLPPEQGESTEDADITADPEVHRPSSSITKPSGWQLKPGGILDRSSTSLHDITISDLESLDFDTVRSFIANHNTLISIPACINLLASNLITLDLPHNKLSGTAYLKEPLDLPQLRDLNLACNTTTSLNPLLICLSAPQLQALNISYNRLTELPALRTTYPALTTLLASDNAIEELPVESVKGLQVCDISRNAITHLEPGLGLLEAEGLRMLGVEGNRFRVPRRDVVVKGTGAILAWLRDRIPLE